MAPLDSSELSRIPDYAPQPATARSQAYTLANLMDEQQLNRLRLTSARREQTDRDTTREVLKTADLSTPKGATQAAEKLARAGVDPTPFMREMQGLMAGQGQLNLQQYELLTAKTDLITGAIGGLVNQYDDLIQKGVPDVQARAAVQPQYIQELQRLSQTKLPDGSPALWPQDLQQVQQHPTFDPVFLRSKAGETKAGMEKLKAAMGRREGEASIQLKEAETQKAYADVAARQSGQFSDDDAKFVAEQYIAGDKSVLTGLGRGTQGAGNIVKVRRFIREVAHERGMEPRAVAARIAEFTGLMSEERALGTRQAAIETAATEADKVIPIALKASAAVARGDWVPVNRLIQKGQVMTSNRALARFAQANLTLANVYARAMSPTGVPTVSGRDHALDILGTASSQDAYEGVVDIIRAEIDAARTSPQSVREDIRRDFTGSQSAAPSAAPGRVLTYDPTTGTFKQ